MRQIRRGLKPEASEAEGLSFSLHCPLSDYFHNERACVVHGIECRPFGKAVVVVSAGVEVRTRNSGHFGNPGSVRTASDDLLYERLSEDLAGLEYGIHGLGALLGGLAHITFSL